ncbi:MAG: septum formation initiator family protein [Desulfobulbaceae bacterium]|nr:septum formation initiator family protein [Desulfobulbaceae bacterium]
MQWFKKKRTASGVSHAAPRRQQSRLTSRSGFWLAAGIVALLLLAWVLFAPGSGYLYYRKAQQDLASIKQKKLELEQNNAVLRQEIERLKTDEAYIEKVAREKHGLLKKDERVYEFNRPERK